MNRFPDNADSPGLRQQVADRTLAALKRLAEKARTGKPIAVTRITVKDGIATFSKGTIICGGEG